MFDQEPWIEHCFGVSETIRAVIKLKNGLDISDEELNVLNEEFNKLNDYKIPKPGMVFKIPLKEYYV